MPYQPPSGSARRIPPLAVAGAATAVFIGALVIAAVLAPSPDSGTGTIEVTVSRDHGQKIIVSRQIPYLPGMTAMDAIDAVARVEKGYGGMFVEAIDGISSTGGPQGGFDWFLFINGAFSLKGATLRTLQPDDRVQWDFRRWTPDMNGAGGPPARPGTPR